MRQRESFSRETTCIYVFVHHSIAYRLPVVWGREHAYVFSDDQSILNYERFRKDYQKPHLLNVLQYSERVFSIAGEYSYIAYSHDFQSINPELFRLISRGYFVNESIVFAGRTLYDDDLFQSLLSDFHQQLRTHFENVKSTPVSVPFDPERYLYDGE